VQQWQLTWKLIHSQLLEELAKHLSQRIPLHADFVPFFGSQERVTVPQKGDGTLR
jgi:hypothetical protein